MKDLTDFVKRELYPALFERVPEAFPGMEFQHYGGGWASPKKMDGTDPTHARKDKTVITRKKPQRALENGQGGDSLDLIDLYKSLNGISSNIEAIKQLCSICGLTLPEMGDSRQWEEYKEKQNKLEELVKRMKRDLQAEEGAATLDYLQNGRGYSPEFIEWAEFGHVSGERVNALRELFSYTNKDGQEVGLPYGVGDVYSLAIPYRSGSTIQGFVFRSTLTEEQRTRTTKDGLTYTLPKYKDAFISASASKKFHLFGLTGINLTGNRERDKEIVVVEGEIDQLRATYAGVKNVVAASGGNISQEALQEAKKLGVERVNLLFDTEESEESQRGNYDKAKKALETIHAQGLRTFVTYLEADGPNQKQDVDSYLRTHTGEQLQAAIEESPTGPMFLFCLISKSAVEKTGDGNDTTDKNLDEYKRQTLELCNAPFVSPTDRDTILRKFSESTGDYITKESLQEEADLQKAAADQARRDNETRNVIAEAYRRTLNGEAAEGVAEFVSGKLQGIMSISREGEFAKLLALPTVGEIASRRKEKPTGLSTGYYFSRGDEEEELLLPSGALTYVCAPTSHGKSRFLENLALNLATEGNEGTVLYFSYEESKADVEAELLNIYANVELSANNIRTLGAYYREGDTSKIKGMASRSETERASARRKLEEFRKGETFFDKLLTSGKLRVFYEDYDSAALVEAIRYITRQTKVKAVFVDYIQLLHKAGSRLQRKDELKEICKEFMSLAVDTKLPVVLAAQLNREAYSPLDMTIQNIAEASDIEHSANIVLLLWNSSVKPTPQKSSYYISAKGELSREADRLEARGFEIGKPGKLYATLAKNRGGARGMDAVLDFNGNTGRIWRNNGPAQAGEDDPF